MKVNSARASKSVVTVVSAADDEGVDERPCDINRKARLAVCSSAADESGRSIVRSSV